MRNSHKFSVKFSVAKFGESQYLYGFNYPFSSRRILYETLENPSGTELNKGEVTVSTTLVYFEILPKE